MTYQLISGDKVYSSWSLRGWLLLERFGLPFTTQWVDFSTRDVRAQLAAHPPARTVPVLLTEDGSVISDSLAMAEELASRHPDAGLWPNDPPARATARTLACEMHSAFAALRDACPMNLRTALRDVPVSDAVKADLRRLEEIWADARARFGGDGPWLCGDYSAADAFYAPIAARIAGYGLDVSSDAQAYVSAHLSDPAFRRWRAMGLCKGAHLEWYERDGTAAEWPFASPRSGQAVDGVAALNDSCPYSGDPVTHVMELDGRRWGFCNAFCRGKTLSDPDAWPAFTEMEAAQS